MSNPLAMKAEFSNLEQSLCTKHALDFLGSEVRRVKWHTDLLDCHGDPCGRMCLGLDSSLPAHADFRWSCQINGHFGSQKYHDGPLACGMGDTPQQAYEAACAAFERYNRPELAALFRRFNHD